MAPPPTARATLTTVAQRAGVSRQTVSNVLHRPAVVLAETRSRVEAAIAELDYQPHLAARQMRTSRSQAVAVRLQHGSRQRDGINAVVLDRFVHALCAAGERHGYHLVVFTATDDADEITAYQHLDRTLNIDGYVVVGTHPGDRRIAWLAAQGRPFVAFGRPWSERTDESGETGGAGGPDHSWVDVDGAAGTEAAARSLWADGHRCIAFCGWSDSLGTGDDRESGWRRALDDLDPAGLRAVVRGSDSVEEGAALAKVLGRDHPGVTAAVCVSDSIAVGLHRRRPDLAVVGFDDTATARVLGLSSVAQPYETAAARCFDLLHRQLRPDPPGPGPVHVLLPPTLHRRKALS